MNISTFWTRIFGWICIVFMPKMTHDLRINIKHKKNYIYIHHKIHIKAQRVLRSKRNFQKCLQHNFLTNSYIQEHLHYTPLFSSTLYLLQVRFLLCILPHPRNRNILLRQKRIIFLGIFYIQLIRYNWKASLPFGILRYLLECQRSNWVKKVDFVSFLS